MKNPMSPREVFNSSNLKYFFDCPDCGHTWDTTLSHMNCSERWCPYCTRQKLCEDPDCSFCFERSFASSEQAKYWSKKNDLSPREVFKSSHSHKYWFDCPLCDKSFEMRPAHVTKGEWCKCQKNKTESILKDWLEENTSHDVVHQKEFNWSYNQKTGRFFKYDFFIEELKLIVELDGGQHFYPVTHWDKTPEEIQKRDHYKEDQAVKNGLSVVRLLQQDVWNNRGNWQEKLKAELSLHEKPGVVYLYEGKEKEIHLKPRKMVKLVIKKK